MHENLRSKSYTEKIIPHSVISFDDTDTIQNKYPPEKYKKLASTLLLRKAGLPVLPGFVVDRLDTEVIEFLSGWARSMKSERLSLRFDSPNKEDNINLSSLNPSLEELEKVAYIIAPPVIGIVLAENDRYKQSHSTLIQFQSDRILCEVVGPGFDAGDLTRGNVSPHEVIEIIRKDLDSFTMFSDLSPQDIMMHRIINTQDYEKSRMLRFGTIYATINKGLGRSVLPQNIDEKGIGQVNEFLNKRGAVVPTRYQPLGGSCLRELYSHFVLLDTFNSYYKNNFSLDVSGKVLSASFLEKHGLVFWDLYGGEKYTKIRSNF